MPPDNDRGRPGERAAPNVENSDGIDTLTIPDLTDQNRKAALRAIRTRAHTETEQRRARVLKFPDLAEGLTRPPLNYKRPDQWGGFVPPALLAEDAQCIAIDGHAELTLACSRDLCGHEHGARRNDSPRRAALVEISAEAWRREHQQVAS